MVETRVIGVYHNIQHPDYKKVMDYFRAKIQPEERVTVESPWDLDKILFEGKNHHAPQYRFLHNLCILLNEVGAQAIPVEDMRIYRIRARLRTWYMFDGTEDLEKDWKYQKTSVIASIRLLELAQEEGSSTLICGILHAYDLQKIGHPNVVMLSEIPLEVREKEDTWIEKYGKSLL